MWSRADLEKFYRGFFWVLVVITMLVIGLGLFQCSAKADEVTSPMKMLQHPIVCRDNKEFYDDMGHKGGFPLWQGIHDKTFLDIFMY